MRNRCSKRLQEVRGAILVAQRCRILQESSAVMDLALASMVKNIQGFSTFFLPKPANRDSTANTIDEFAENYLQDQSKLFN